jgi:hypothetical protein
MEKSIIDHMKEKDHYDKVQKDLHEWEDRVVECKELKWFCFKENIKRRLKKMITIIRKNISSIIVGIIIILFLLFVFTHKDLLITPINDDTDWISPKTTISNFIEISNGNESLRVHKDSMIVYTPIWCDTGALICYYVLFDYRGSRLTLELTDNEAGTMEEWKESIEACFPVGDSNE